MEQKLLIVPLALAALAAAVPAFAQLTQPPLAMPGQQRQARPNRSVFGGGTSQDASQRLVLNASLGAGYDEDLTKYTAPASPAPAYTPPRSGQFGVGSAALAYTVDTTRVAGGLSISAHGRYYSSMTRSLVGAYNGNGHLAFRLGSRTSLSVNVQSGLYQQNLAVFQGDGLGGMQGAPIDTTAFANGNTFTSLRGGARFNQGVTTRLALYAGYDYYVNDAWSPAGAGRYSAQTGQAGMSFSLAKGLGLRLGYSVAGSGFGAARSGAPYQSRTFDGGVDFNRSLSLTRQATLSFGTGVSGFSDQNLRTRYFATGHLGFGYEIGRSWTANAGYQRTANLDQTFGQPVIADSANVGVGGLVGRRVQVNTSATATRGTLGITSGAPGYMAGSAGAGVQIGVRRELALGLYYTYFRYEFDGGTALPPGMPSRMERQTVRLSLNMWVPLLTRARRANAAR